jgi:hypothetical protein
VIFLGLGVFMLWQNRDMGPARTVVGWDRDFKVPADEVQKIFLADRNGNQTTLTRTREGWSYNDSYPVREDAIRNLLQAVSRIEMAYMPTQAAVPVMVKSLATRGIKVEVYGRGDELLKAYYVGGATNREDGVYVIMEGSEQPYVAHLPDWVGNLRFRYNLVGDDWKSRQLFILDPAQIEELSVEYPKQKSKSFRLQRESDPMVKPFYPLGTVRAERIDPAKVSQYLSRIDQVQMNRFFNYGQERDSILSQIPFANIRVQTPDRTHTLSVYPQLSLEYVDGKTGEVTEESRVLGYYGLLNERDFILIQEQNIRKLLWAYDFFFFEDN